MNNLQRYTKYLIKWILAAVFLVPALGWAHGAVDTPIARQVKCQKDGGYWASQDGSSIKDKGCKGAALVFPSPALWAYQFQQWNEVAHLIAAPGYNNPSIVEAEIPDGKLCSAGDDKKAGLNRVSSDWFQTVVTPVNGMMTVRIIGTAPHVPSFAKVFLTKPGFDPTQSPLTWKDLTLIHTEQLTVAQTNWGTNPPAIPGASGFFEFQVPVPSGQGGNAILFIQWQRIDPAGEGFYNCSDINIVNAGTPPSWFDIGAFIDAIMDALKPGDSVHFRILDNSPAAKEVVDIKLLITAANLDKKIWGQRLANQISPAIAKVGEKQGNNVVFNTTDPSANSVFATAKGYSQAMAIIPGGVAPINPTAPQARITGPTQLMAGKTYTFDGRSSVGSNGPLAYQWSPGGLNTQSLNQSTLTGVAPNVGQPTELTARLLVRDLQNGKTHQAEFKYTVSSSGGGQQPDGPYVPSGSHEAGKIYSHNGDNYKCLQKPWCDGSPTYYEPGKGLAWEQAWEKQ